MSSSVPLGHSRLLSFAVIQEATGNFDESNSLGEGGQGKVYRGIIKDGRRENHVAVKRLKSNSGEFEKEIQMLSKIHHANLVSLVGYCQQLGEKILVYELMPNGSLADKLYPKCHLSWEQCLKILIGAARGLQYLHTGTSVESRIIHRDVKPGNILLDKNLEAKVSDFGLSRRAPANQTRTAVSTDLKCTPGYCAPEYIFFRKITWRVDVYAFGVVLFEVLFRKRPWVWVGSWLDDSNTNVKDTSLGRWAKRNVDVVLRREITNSCLEAFIDIAERCWNQDPEQRPTMDEVVVKLENALKLQRHDFGSSKVAEFEKTPHGTSRSSKSERISLHVDRSRRKPTNSKTISQYDGSGSKSVTSNIALYIPEMKDKVVLYCCQTGDAQMCTDYLKVRLYLNTFGVDIDERDPEVDEKHKKEILRFFKQIQKEYCLPQLFIGGKYVGGVDEVIRLYSSGELGKLLKKFRR